MPSKRSSGRRLAAAQPECLAAYFMDNRYRIIQAAGKPGPYLYGVYKDTIKKLWPR
jgi:hypothetical protein